MSHNTTKAIYLVVSKGEKTKAFGSHDLALEYKQKFCPDGKIEDATLFEKLAETKRSYDPGDPDDSPPRHYKDLANGYTGY